MCRAQLPPRANRAAAAVWPDWSPPKQPIPIVSTRSSDRFREQDEAATFESAERQQRPAIPFAEQSEWMASADRGERPPLVKASRERHRLAALIANHPRFVDEQRNAAVNGPRKTLD